jgi:GNAT superfamily N-acetyltransferase
VAPESGTDRTEDKGTLASPKPAPVLKPLVVERLTHQDINDICALYRRVWEHFRPELPAELVKSWEPTPLEFSSWMEGVTYFAARRDGRMIGAVGCEVTDGSCRIVHLAVDPEHRRQGVATALTAAAIEWARHANAKSLWVDALARFTAAAALLTSQGFSQSGVLHRHRWGEDVMLFEKLL